MYEPGQTTTPSTRQRLLDAAVRVFAERGLEGATTREIARRAGVNEVTLFRHFQSKEKLLGAVLEGTFNRQDATPSNAEAEAPADAPTTPPPRNLSFHLQRFARRYEELLRRNILLIRTLLGEIHRHRDHETQVLHGIFAPLKAELLAALQSARDEGTMRGEIDPAVAADLFSSMIFVDVLRRASHFEPEYPSARYLETAVDVFLRGIES